MNPFQRSFVGEIRRIDEMARRVRFLDSQVEKESNIPVRPLEDLVPLLTVGPSAAATIDELEVKLQEHETRVHQMNESYQTLSTRARELSEARHVLRETAQFFDRVSSTRHTSVISSHESRYRFIPLRRKLGDPLTMVLSLSWLTKMRKFRVLVMDPSTWSAFHLTRALRLH